MSGHTVSDLSFLDGTNDIFVAKVSSDGEWVWAVGAGGSGYGLWVLEVVVMIVAMESHLMQMDHRW